MPTSRLPFLAVSASVAALGSLLFASTAHAQIRQPGAHPDYVVELEPHLVWQYGATEHFSNDGFGLGVRASIPVMKNGPVTTINNNFAISFGLDWAHIDGNCDQFFVGNVYVGNNCTANHILVPIVAQWNFFFTPVVSAFAEFGIGIHHWDESYDCNGVVAGTVIRGGFVCGGSDHGTDPIPLFAMGPRFILSDLFAITIRVGYPSLTIGGSFLL